MTINEYRRTSTVAQVDSVWINSWIHFDAVYHIYGNYNSACWEVKEPAKAVTCDTPQREHMP